MFEIYFILFNQIFVYDFRLTFDIQAHIQFIFFVNSSASYRVVILVFGTRIALEAQKSYSINVEIENHFMF